MLKTLYRVNRQATVLSSYTKSLNSTGLFDDVNELQFKISLKGKTVPLEAWTALRVPGL
jgi:predicted transcriptional regulator